MVAGKLLSAEDAWLLVWAISSGGLSGWSRKTFPPRSLVTFLVFFLSPTGERGVFIIVQRILSSSKDQVLPVDGKGNGSSV
jgi:hypothetical protein